MNVLGGPSSIGTTQSSSSMVGTPVVNIPLSARVISTFGSPPPAGAVNVNNLLNDYTPNS